MLTRTNMDTESKFKKAWKHWSGRRDSHPRPRPWQGRALPLSYTRIRKIGDDRSPAIGRAMPNAAHECNSPGGGAESAGLIGHIRRSARKSAQNRPGGVPPIANWALKRQLGLGRARTGQSVRHQARIPVTTVEQGSGT